MFTKTILCAEYHFTFVMHARRAQLTVYLCRDYQVELLVLLVFVFWFAARFFPIEMCMEIKRDDLTGRQSVRQQVDLSHSTSCSALTCSHFDVSSVCFDKFMHFYTVFYTNCFFIYICKCLCKWYLFSECLISIVRCMHVCVCTCMSCDELVSYMHKCKFSHLLLSFIAIRSIQRPR